MHKISKKQRDMNTTKIIFTTCFCLAKAMFADAETISLDSVSDSLSQRKATDEYIASRVNSLQEVVVKGRRRMFSMKNGVLTTQVSGTTLADEPSLYEVLTHIPGMVKAADGSLEVLGFGAPEIYINGKKATNTQLSALDVRQIDNIRLLTSPGAKYDATMGAVLEIKTHRRNPGYFANVSGTYKASQMNSHNESITTGYADSRFSLSANYSCGEGVPCRWDARCHKLLSARQPVPPGTI